MRGNEQGREILQAVIDEEISAADGLSKLYLLESDLAVVKMGFMCNAAEIFWIDSEVLQKAKRELGISEPQGSVPQPGTEEGGAVKADD